ncbi:PREDICTED: protein SRG1-like isoform X1 [Nicotiana attenuata]|uniref:protein SRG1-like isoform X1 n=1 Tax=Nicotiana attenuata TaxID=49451 RepID=UPI0009046AA5|nr:PREDICTED: protein SRG1-like isoform X1 [Nicotiana attenuata]
MDESPPEVVNFGKSLLVPSVQELANEHLTNIPARYVRPEQESPAVSDGTVGPTVPVIDLKKLVSGDSMDSELQKLHSACQHWGFLQKGLVFIFSGMKRNITLINHGVTPSILENFKREVIELFKLPMEEKKKLWQQEDNHEGFGQLFVVSEEQKLDWSDMFYITTLPPHIRQMDLFQKLPSNLRDIMEAYCSEIKSLAMIILCQLTKALRMDEKEMRELFSDGVQSIRMNYYPPCPEPDKTIGFSPHSDADALTILFQLNETEGLQVQKDGIWVPIKPLPNALIVNIGDIMEIVSNGVYRSIEHRAVVNSNKERLSVATFYSSNLDSELGPARSLIGPSSPAIFRRVPVEKYFKDFFARKLDGKSYIDFMKEEARDGES